MLSHIQLTRHEDAEEVERQRRAAVASDMHYEHAEASALPEADSAPGEDAAASGEAAKPYVRQERKVGRNEPCPCGSGKKYKQCHGRLNA